jgi:hypothetical protein
MDDQQKRDARRAYKEAERGRASEAMVLDETQLSDLLDYLDERLQHAGCDHTLRLTERWAAERRIESRGLLASLEHFGGYCDCEVLANVDPESIF